MLDAKKVAMRGLATKLGTTKRAVADVQRNMYETSRYHRRFPDITGGHPWALYGVFRSRPSLGYDLSAEPGHLVYLGKKNARGNVS